jgi:hypothetical protein
MLFIVIILTWVDEIKVFSKVTNEFVHDILYFY